jgi:hypothetical protein
LPDPLGIDISRQHSGAGRAFRASRHTQDVYQDNRKRQQTPPRLLRYLRHAKSMLVLWIIHRAMVCASARSLSAPASHRGGRAGGGPRCAGWMRSPPSPRPRGVEEHIQTGPMRTSWHAPRPKRMLRSVVLRFECGSNAARLR